MKRIYPERWNWSAFSKSPYDATSTDYGKRTGPRSRKCGLYCGPNPWKSSLPQTSRRQGHCRPRPFRRNHWPWPAASHPARRGVICRPTGALALSGGRPWPGSPQTGLRLWGGDLDFQTRETGLSGFVLSPVPKARDTLRQAQGRLLTSLSTGSGAPRLWWGFHPETGATCLPFPKRGVGWFHFHIHLHLVEILMNRL
jgi:hypothetical protein